MYSFWGLQSISFRKHIQLLSDLNVLAYHIQVQGEAIWRQQTGSSIERPGSELPLSSFSALPDASFHPQGQPHWTLQGGSWAADRKEEGEGEVSTYQPCLLPF